MRSVNESETAVNCSDHDGGQEKTAGQSCDNLVVRHRSRHTCDALVRVGTVREPALQTTNVTLRGANGQDLGAMVEVQVRVH